MPESKKNPPNPSENESRLFPKDPLPGFTPAEGKTTDEIRENVRKMSHASPKDLDPILDEVAAVRSDIRTILDWNNKATDPLNEMRKEVNDLKEWSTRATDTLNQLIASWNAFAEAAGKQPNVADALSKWLPQITQEQERMDRIERYVGAVYAILSKAKVKSEK